MKFKVDIWGLFCLIILISACDDHTIKSNPNKNIEVVTISKSQDSLIQKGTQFLHNGDIVLRTGRDLISTWFSQFNKTDKTFSHCGIAFYEKNSWVVYHSLGGEDNPDAKLRRESFEKFIHPKHNIGFGICHYNLSRDENDTLQKIVTSFYKNQIPFDMKFDLQSDDRLYCAEMIYKAFNKATHQNNFFKTTTHQGFEYVSTDNIFVNENAKMLCKVVF